MWPDVRVPLIDDAMCKGAVNLYQDVMHVYKPK